MTTAKEINQQKDETVKKLVISAIVACSLFALFGCHNRAEVQTLTPAQASELQPMQQSYRGVLPCADCAGIETSLFLEKDGTWVMNQRYQGAKQPTVFASYGSWTRTADKLILTQSEGEKLYFRPTDDGLVMLDRTGNRIESQLNYTLKPVNAALPATPMAMKGMYKYMADAAIFKDCATGKTFDVASNAELERGYAAARGDNFQPVLLVIEAHFTLQASPDTGELRKTIVADSAAKFVPKKGCND